jgi:hypothetical protein
MSSAARQRLFTAAILLALAILMIAGGVALALAEGMQPVAALITTPLVLAVFVLLLRTDTALLLRLLVGLELLLPIAVFGLTILLMGKTAGTVRFDEVGAQVIIVLLLALAVDARFFRLRVDRDRLDVLAILYTVLLLAVGEYLALRGLLTSDPARAEMIAGAIAAGFSAVAVTALVGAQSFGDEG